MDRPQTLPSTPSTSNKAASGPFAYQTRLLERTSSASRASPLARTRSTSQSTNPSVLTNSTGSSSSSAIPRRWNASHRSSNSMDLMRGKWEERSRDAGEAALPLVSSPSPTKEVLPRMHTKSTSAQSSVSTGSEHQPIEHGDQLDSSAKDLPPIPSAPSRIDAVRDRWEVRSREVDVPPSPSWTSAKESTRFSPLNSSFTSSSTSSSVLGTSTGSGIDAVRGRWEERSKDVAASPSPTKESFRPSSALSSYASSSKPEFQRTPTYLKRQTMPAPIIANPLSPNTTGVSVEVDSPTSATPTRIRLPHTATSSQSSLSQSSLSQLDRTHTSIPSTPTRLRGSTLGEPSSSVLPSIHVRDTDASRDATPRRRPTSSQGFYSHLTSSSSTDRFQRSPQAEQPKSALGSPLATPSKPESSSPPNSVMTPAPYRSSYMAGKAKKIDSYRDSLGVNGQRKLGRHLPRIASGDADENWEARDQPTPPLPPPDMPRFQAPSFQAPSVVAAAAPPRDDVSARREKRLARLRDMKQESALPSEVVPPSSDDVAGMPGRISLKAPKGDQAPVPSARLLGATWADRQRHLIQAYEYLCHVGEAQQWIEGCLGEELEFGVVEMEEGLRNGVVLAKLVRAFDGAQVVRRIYEAPKLDFRHSDNINIFFDFLRREGLPEGFIFELTDLYNKKNIPKVIYCIHALSHLLARRGKAQRIGNLLGQLQFSDDQLTKTQKGLKDAGVSMPNFGNVGKELAKEINEEPEVEVETEDERRDRLLLENEESIIRLQACCRGVLLRRSHKALLARIKLSEKHVVKFQTHAFGALLRRQLGQQRRVQSQLVPWATALQAEARASIVRQRLNRHLRKIRSTSPQVTKLQAQIRGVLMRRRYAKMKAALQKLAFSFTKIQAVARAHVTRHARSQLQKTFFKPQVSFSIVRFQAQARGVIIRRRLSSLVRSLTRREKAFVGLQAQCRGILIRRRMRAQMAKIRTQTDVVISIQSAVRTYLARKRLLGLIRGLRKATPFIVGLQSLARANLMRQEHKSVEKALRHVHTVSSVQSFQALARASLTRKKHQQLNKTLEIATPDVLNLQSAARGFLLRQEYYAWRDHLHRSHPVATILQAMLRGAIQRRAFRQKLNYFKDNLSKVVKIQSLFRAKETREQYRQLTLGTNVSVSTIKNFVHLLDDSEADFQEEIKIERLRKKVVEAIRENQALENDVNELDVKIALVVQNAMNYEDLLKAKKKYGGDSAVSQAARASLLAAHGDPFSGPHTLDQEARRKLELYQQLFYLLQSRGEYLSRLFIRLNQVKYPDASRRFMERVVLTLFGYGQDHREDFLLLKLFQFSIRDQVSIANSINDVMEGSTMYLNVAVHYLRSKQATYVREVFRPILKDVIESDDLNLEVDPVIIHRLRIEHEEMRSGRASNQPKDVSFRDAIQDPETRPIYIRHLQTLHWWTKRFMEEIIKSTKRMPFGVRYLSRELLIWLRHKFPDVPDDFCARCVGRLVYYRYINPAIITPETFDVVSKTVDVASRKNLAQVSKVLTQIANGQLFEEDSAYAPLNDYVQEAIGEMNAWLLTVADVPDAETQYHAHEFLDVTVQPKPIYISPNEIYSLHTLLSENQDFLASKDDPLRIILSELGGVPHLDNEELKDARDTAITLELTNRFASVQDPHAEEKTLWVQAKRGVLAILRVQPAQDLLESLMRPVTENDEMVWEDILEAEMENEIKQMPRRQPSQAVPDSAYRLEDIRSLKFAAVKALAIQNLLELERQNKITRNDGFQGILNAIAGDVRSKHRKRIQRQHEMDSMSEALRQLGDRKKHFLEQIDSYHSYVDSAMSTMQRGGKKKRLVLPFTRQFYHERELEKTGQRPKYGSYLYTAKKLYDREILLSIDGYSPRQFDKLNITLSSNTPGVFNVLLESNMLAVVSRIGSEDIKMEDLLQAKYERRASLSLLGGKMKVNFELFLLQVNKKFYGS